MSDKEKVDSTAIAEALVKDEEVKTIGFACVCPMVRRASLVRGSDTWVLYGAERVKSYPPNITDQTHALSIAEQVKVGQAQVRNDDVQDEYDFKRGERDDGRSAVGVYEYSEPAERFEAERVVAFDIQGDLDAQLQKIALQKQMAARREAENEKTAKSNQLSDAREGVSFASVSFFDTLPVFSFSASLRAAICF